MKKFIHNRTLARINCQITKINWRKLTITPLTFPEACPMEVIIVDELGPLTKSANYKHSYVIMICVMNTRYIIATSARIRKRRPQRMSFINNLILRYGILKIIDRNFDSLSNTGRKSESSQLIVLRLRSRCLIFQDTDNWISRTYVWYLSRKSETLHQSKLKHLNTSICSTNHSSLFVSYFPLEIKTRRVT